MNLVDSNYELIDPNPDLHETFILYNETFFEGKLAACEVIWSTRLTKCAGICQYQPQAGYCSIRLSEPLLKLRPRKDFVNTLLHEMIHAYLFVTSHNMDRDGHGPNFQFHMNRINNIAGTNITVYHTFHAEVAYYQTSKVVKPTGGVKVPARGKKLGSGANPTPGVSRLLKDLDKKGKGQKLGSASDVPLGVSRLLFELD